MSTATDLQGQETEAIDSHNNQVLRLVVKREQIPTDQGPVMSSGDWQQSTNLYDVIPSTSKLCTMRPKTAFWPKELKKEILNFFADRMS